MSSPLRTSGFVTLVITLCLSVLGTPAAAAAPLTMHPTAPAPHPADPTSAEQAQQMWIDAAREYAHFGERVLDVQAAVKKADERAARAATSYRQAKQRAETAKLAGEAAARRATAARAVVRSAQEVVADYQSRIDEFTNASFRGARTGTIAALLMASSPDDFLDTATALDAVAADNRDLIGQARRVTEQARQAALRSDEAQREVTRTNAEVQRTLAIASRIKTEADQARATALASQRNLAADKKALAVKIERAQRLYARLSAADRSAAVSADEGANASAAAAARHASQRASRGADAAAADQEPGITESKISLEDLSVRAAQQAPSVAAGIAVTSALSRVGLPYVWAAVGPDTFDCSGLMMWAWQKAGVSIPRSSAVQATLPVIPLDQLKPGDLVTYYSPTSHVGMYVGDGLVVHASMPGVPIKVVPLHRAGPNAVGHSVNR